MAKNRFRDGEKLVKKGAKRDAALTTCRFLPAFAILKYNFIRTFLPAKKVPKKAALAKPPPLGQPEAEICYDECK